MARPKGGNPHPGRFIHVWVKEAGFCRENIKKSAVSWCFSSLEERKYWGGSMEERTRSSRFPVTAIQEGFASPQDMENVVMGWRDCVKDGDAWLRLLHEEVLCWK